MGVTEMESFTASNLFETSLIQTKAFLVIGQNQIEEILDAHPFEPSEYTYESSAVEIGNILDAEQIILGSFSKVGSGYIINAKIIDVSLGQNIQAEKVEFSTMDDLSKSLEMLAYKLAGLTFKQGGEDIISTTFRELFISTQEELNRVEEIQRLIEERTVLELKYEKERVAEKRRNTFKYIFSGLSIVSMRTSGVTWSLGNEAYSKYATAVIESEVVEYRDQSQMYDVIKFSSGAVGIGFTILSLINWFTVDRRPEIEQKIAIVSAQIAELEAK